MLRSCPVPMTDPKLIGALGLAVRARGAVIGQQAVNEAVSRGRARLLIMDPSVSEGSKKQWEALADHVRIPLVVLEEKDLLSQATGRVNARICAVVDPNFVKLIRSRIVSDK